MEWVSEIREPWVREAFDHRIIEESDVYLDLDSRKVVRRKYSKLDQLKFSMKETFEVSEDEVSLAYAKALSSGELVLKHWDSKVRNFLSRIEFLHHHFPDYDVEPPDEDSMELIYYEICSGRGSWKSIRNQEALPYLRNFYGENRLQVLDDAVPETIDLKNGKKPYPVKYDSRGARVSVYLQDLYDLEATPRIVHGKYDLLIDVLAPNGRSCQLTSDLPGFWKGSYLQVKKELAGRYPKHEWR